MISAGNVFVIKATTLCDFAGVSLSPRSTTQRLRKVGLRRLLVFAARCYASAAYAFMRCPSVTFVNSVKTNKHVFNIFSPSGSHTIVVFPYQTSWQRERRMQVG